MTIYFITPVSHEGKMPYLRCYLNIFIGWEHKLADRSSLPPASGEEKSKSQSRYVFTQPHLPKYVFVLIKTFIYIRKSPFSYTLR